MIKKRLVAATAMATLAPLTLAACGGGGSNDAGSESSATDTVKSLTILDYYNNDPDKSLVTSAERDSIARASWPPTDGAW